MLVFLFFSKLPIRQVTPAKRLAFICQLSKLPIRQVTDKLSK